MDAQSKSFLTSVTFWGIVLGFAGPLAAHLGWTLPSDTSGLANQIAGALGDLVALYGRFRATQPLHIVTPSTAPSQGGFARIELLVLIALAFAIAACTTTPKSPAQAVYLIEADYAAALTVAVKYKALPPCGQSASVVICSNPAVIATLQKADDAAFSALSEAQALVRTPGIGEDKVATAVAIANSALKVLVAVTASLPIK